MGNRGVITTKDKTLGVYLHWNGGRDSVEAILTYCHMKGYRSPSSDSYGWARLCQVIGNYFGGTLSLGISTCTESPGDNGVYIIENWKIVGREGYSGSEQDEYDLREMIDEINYMQPDDERLQDHEIDEYFSKYMPVSHIENKCGVEA